MIKATLTKEITVETANSAGVAAKLTQLVSKQAKTNIRSAWAAGANGKGHFALITDDNKKAIEILKKDFPETSEHDVLVINSPNHMGEIALVTDELSQAGLNIDFLYTTYYDEHPAIVLSTNDNKKALGVINH